MAYDRVASADECIIIQGEPEMDAKARFMGMCHGCLAASLLNTEENSSNTHRLVPNSTARKTKPQQ